jgi:hypothetical protein
VERAAIVPSVPDRSVDVANVDVDAPFQFRRWQLPSQYALSHGRSRDSE